MCMRIRAKAPLRLSFAGGGTDVSPFIEREGGCVLSATITRYSWGTLTPREDSQIHLESEVMSPPVPLLQAPPPDGLPG